MEKTRPCLGVNKKVLKKRNKKKINKVVDYLKSDFYMFAPLVSSPRLDHSTTKGFYASFSRGVEWKRKINEGRNENFLKSVGEFLKSDNYMYAPLLNPQVSNDDSVMPFKETTSASAATGEMLKENEHSTKRIERARGDGDDQASNGIAFKRNAIVRQTITHWETVKHVIHHSCRSASVPGKGVIESGQIKLVE